MVECCRLSELHLVLVPHIYVVEDSTLRLSGFLVWLTLSRDRSEDVRVGSAIKVTLSYNRYIRRLSDARNWEVTHAWGTVREALGIEWRTLVMRRIFDDLVALDAVVWFNRHGIILTHELLGRHRRLTMKWPLHRLSHLRLYLDCIVDPCHNNTVCCIVIQNLASVVHSTWWDATIGDVK